MWLSGGASSGIGGWGVASVGESAEGVVGSVARPSSGLVAVDGEVGEVVVGDIVLWGLVGDRRWRFCAGEEFEGRRAVGIFLGLVGDEVNDWAIGACCGFEEALVECNCCLNGEEEGVLDLTR